MSDQLFLPIKTNLLFLITSLDVIHSFALPSLRVKADANPGRLNRVRLNCPVPGNYVGQCRELCGSLHSNIRINIEFSRASLILRQIILNQE